MVCVWREGIWGVCVDVFVRRGHVACLLWGMVCVFRGKIVCVRDRLTSSVMVFDDKIAS